MSKKMILFNADNLKSADYGCTEYAIKRLTGINLLKITFRKPGEIGFDNVEKLTLGFCKIFVGSVQCLKEGKLNGTILQIHPKRQKDLHSVILISALPGKSKAIIEDQVSRRAVNLESLVKEWKKAGMKYMKCGFIKFKACK